MLVKDQFGAAAAEALESFALDSGLLAEAPETADGDWSFTNALFDGRADADVRPMQLTESAAPQIDSNRAPTAAEQTGAVEVRGTIERWRSPGRVAPVPPARDRWKANQAWTAPTGSPKPQYAQSALAPPTAKEPVSAPLPAGAPPDDAAATFTARKVPVDGPSVSEAPVDDAVFKTPISELYPEPPAPPPSPEAPYLDWPRPPIDIPRTAHAVPIDTPRTAHAVPIDTPRTAHAVPNRHSDTAQLEATETAPRDHASTEALIAAAQESLSEAPASTPTPRHQRAADSDPDPDETPHRELIGNLLISLGLLMLVLLFVFWLLF